MKNVSEKIQAAPLLLATSFSAFLFLCLTLVPTLAHADEDWNSVKVRDRVILRSGSTLHGEVIEEKAKFVVFETVQGDTVKLARRLIHKIRKISEDEKRYNKALDTLKDDAKSHYEMILWCEEQDGGQSRYKEQILFHSQRIIEHDPNDAQARKKLGMKKVSELGRWVDERQYWESLGYVKRGAIWVPTIQMDIAVQNKTFDNVKGGGKSKFANWKKQIDRVKNRQTLSRMLMQFADVHTAELMFKELKKERRGAVHDIYMEAFGNIPCGYSVSGLVFYAVEKESDRAIDLLKQETFNQQAAVNRLLPYLAQTKSNKKINRAALVIGQLGLESPILHLVDALNTVHVVRQAGDPNRMGAGFSQDGRLNGFSTGNNQPEIKRPFKNDNVLKALETITKQNNLDYNETAWRNWYVQNHTYHDLPARR